MVRNRQIITQSPAETERVGENFGNYLRIQNSEFRTHNNKREDGSTTVVCLYGELGSGKTIFVRGFAKGLGITSRLLSPTFIIVRRYKIPESTRFLYHVDLYRTQKIEELAGLGLAEILNNPDALVVVEWAEKLGTYIPEKRLDVQFTTLENGRHAIKIG